MEKEKNDLQSRRTFLKKGSALAAAGFYICATHVLGGTGFICTRIKLRVQVLELVGDGIQ